MKQEFDLVVKGKEWVTLQDEAFEKVNKSAKIDGFRPGKAPRSMYEKKYGKQDILFEAADMAVKKEYERLLVKEKLMPVIEPKVDLVKCDDKELEVKFIFVLEPKIELGNYTNLGVKHDKITVTKEEIEERIHHLLEDYAEIVAKDGKVDNGDTAIIDFKGLKDGVAFDGGTAENYSLVIGSHTFIPGFEEAIVGMKKGEEKDIELTFPKDYMSEELKGQKVTFKVKVNEIKTRVVPKLDKEFFEDLGMDGVDTKESLEKSIKETIKARKVTEADNKYVDDLLAKVAENTEVEIPEEMIDDEVHRLIHRFEEQLKMQGISLDLYYEFTKTTHEDLHKQMEPEALKTLKYRYLIDAVAEAEKIKTTKKEVDERAEEVAKMYGVSKDELIKEFGSLEVVEYDLRMHKALELIKKENEKTTK